MRFGNNVGLNLPVCPNVWLQNSDTFAFKLYMAMTKRIWLLNLLKYEKNAIISINFVAIK